MLPHAHKAKRGITLECRANICGLNTKSGGVVFEDDFVPCKTVKAASGLASYERFTFEMPFFLLFFRKCHPASATCALLFAAHLPRCPALQIKGRVNDPVWLFVLQFVLQLPPIPERCLRAPEQRRLWNHLKGLNQGRRKKKWRFTCTSVRRPGSPAVHLNPSVACKSKQSMNSLFRRELAPIKIPLSINSSGLPSNTHLLCKRVFPRMCAALFYFFNSSSSLTL